MIFSPFRQPYDEQLEEKEKVLKRALIQFGNDLVQQIKKHKELTQSSFTNNNNAESMNVEIEDDDDGENESDGWIAKA
jgi:replicative DNA helicase